jgi:hypothetical protein
VFLCFFEFLEEMKMKKLVLLLVVLLLSANGFAAVYTNTVTWAGEGDWMEQSHWTDSPTTPNWNIPGWVVDNPLNTVPSTSPDWNGGYAHIDSGICNITPASNPDGTVAIMYVGSAADSATLNISDDLTIRKQMYIGYESVSSSIATINHTAGTVTYGTDATLANRRFLMGRGAGTSVYNLSGTAVMTTSADYDSIGYDGTSTSIFNMTGGTINDTGTALQIGNSVGSTGIVNLSGGTLNAYGSAGIYIGVRTDSTHTGTLNLSGTGVLNSHDIKVSYLAGSTGLLKISGGSLNCDRIWYTLNGGKSVISGSGATSIVTKQFSADGKTLGIELDADGSTLIEVVGLAAETYHGAFLIGSTLEVSALTGFDSDALYNILWSAAELDTTGLVFNNLTGVNMDWRVVNYNLGGIDGQMLQLVVPEPATICVLLLGSLMLVRRKRA